jgi:hypothetical protein
MHAIGMPAEKGGHFPLLVTSALGQSIPPTQRHLRQFPACVINRLQPFLWAHYGTAHHGSQAGAQIGLGTLNTMCLVLTFT